MFNSKLSKPNSIKTKEKKPNTVPVMDFKLRGLKKKSNISILLGSCRYTDFSVYLGVTEEMKYFSNDSC